jgi:hypothetical protein
MGQVEIDFATQFEQHFCLGACSNLCLELTGLRLAHRLTWVC